jgi:Tfp pilus assembly protein PilO
MTTRDRLVIVGLLTFAILAGAWFLAVSPERGEATKLDAQVSAAEAQLASAESQASEAKTAQARYAAAYASVVRLGKAVPSEQQVPSLVYQLDQASNQKFVNFSSITSGTSGVTPAAAATTPVATGGFTSMPFTFVFKGTYFSLSHMFDQINRFTVRTPSGGVQVNGRLLTIQSAKLENNQESSASTGLLTGTITATAYVLPAGQGLTGGATESGPAASSSQTVSGAGSSSSASTPAVVQVTP